MSQLPNPSSVKSADSLIFQGSQGVGTAMGQAQLQGRAVAAFVFWTVTQLLNRDVETYYLNAQP